MDTMGIMERIERLKQEDPEKARQEEQRLEEQLKALRQIFPEKQKEENRIRKKELQEQKETMNRLRQRSSGKEELMDKEPALRKPIAGMNREQRRKEQKELRRRNSRRKKRRHGKPA